MSLVKTTEIDKVEFVGKWKTLQVRHLTEIKDGDETLAKNYSRDSYQVSTSISELPTELQPYATGVWTDKLIAEWNAYEAEKNAEQAALEQETTE